MRETDEPASVKIKESDLILSRCERWNTKLNICPFVYCNSRLEHIESVWGDTP